MRILLILLAITILVSCASQRVREPGTIGPCYGSVSVNPVIQGCLYDTDYDGVPDIILFHQYIDGVAKLIHVMTIDEYEALNEQP